MGAFLRSRSAGEDLQEIQFNEVQLHAKSEPPGLKNIGNTCYMNAALQCLLQTDLLTSALSQSMQGRGSSAQHRMIESYRSIMSEPKSTSHLRRLKGAFNSIHRRYSGYKQMDSNEFFLDLLNAFVELSPEVKESVGGLFKVEITDKKKCEKCKNEKEGKYELLSLSLPLPPAHVSFRVFGIPPLKAVEIHGLENWTAEQIRDKVQEQVGIRAAGLVLTSGDSVVKLVPDTDSLHTLSLQSNALHYYEKQEEDEVVVELRLLTVSIARTQCRCLILTKHQMNISIGILLASLNAIVTNQFQLKDGEIVLAQSIGEVSCFGTKKLPLITPQLNLKEEAKDGILRLEYRFDLKLQKQPLYCSELNRADDPVELQDALNDYSHEQSPDPANLVQCEHCAQDTAFSQCSTVSQTSAYFVICLQRYSSIDSQKDYRFVRVMQTLHMPVADTQYRLYAVIKHRGDHTRGHYTSVVRQGEQWFSCDDKVVTRLEEAEVTACIQEDAYILFYRREE